MIKLNTHNNLENMLRGKGMEKASLFITHFIVMSDHRGMK